MDSGVLSRLVRPAEQLAGYVFKGSEQVARRCGDILTTGQNIETAEISRLLRKTVIRAVCCP